MIQYISPRDFPAIISMLQFFREESPEYNYVSDDPAYVTRNLNSMWDSGMGFGVLDSDGKGFMLAAVSPTWYSERIDASEQVLFVYPPFRGSSLAIRMIKEVEAMCRRLRVHTFHVGVSTGIKEERVVRMYERLGFKSKGHSLSKVLEYV
jgi:GNAT superfamily N-acetyltransferase